MPPARKYSTTMNNSGKEEIMSATGDGQQRIHTQEISEEEREKRRQWHREWRRNLPEEKRLYLQRRNLERRRIRTAKARENTDDKQRLAEKHARTLRQESYRKWRAQMKEEKREIQIQPPNDDGVVYLVMAEEAEAEEAQTLVMVEHFPVERGYEGVFLTGDGSRDGGGFVCVSKLETSEPAQVETVVAGHPVPGERDHREGVISPDNGSGGGDQWRSAEKHPRILRHKRYRNWCAQVKKEKREIQIQPPNDDGFVCVSNLETSEPVQVETIVASDSVPVERAHREGVIAPDNGSGGGGFVCVSKLETSEREQVEAVVAEHPVPAERDHREGVIAPDNGSGGAGFVCVSELETCEPEQVETVVAGHPVPEERDHREGFIAPDNGSGAGGGGFVCVIKLETSEPEQVETVVAGHPVPAEWDHREGVIAPDNGSGGGGAVCIDKVVKAEPDEVEAVDVGHLVPGEWDRCEDVTPAWDRSGGVMYFVKDEEAAEPEQVEEFITGLPLPEESDFEGVLAPDDGSGGEEGQQHTPEPTAEEERRARKLLKQRERDRIRRAKARENEDERQKVRERSRRRRAKAKEEEDHILNDQQRLAEKHARTLRQESYRNWCAQVKAKKQKIQIQPLNVDGLSPSEKYDLILQKRREQSRMRRAQKEGKQEIQKQLSNDDGQEFMLPRTPEHRGEESQQSPDAGRTTHQNEDEDDSADLGPPLPIETVWLEGRLFEDKKVRHRFLLK